MGIAGKPVDIQQVLWMSTGFEVGYSTSRAAPTVTAITWQTVNSG